MGLGHLCGGGGIRGETVEYPTEFGVTAGDLCIISPATEEETITTSKINKTNPIRFQRSDGQFVYFFGNGNLSCQIENQNEITLLNYVDSTHEYYIYDGYLVASNIVHLFVYSGSGFSVLEIDISNTPQIKKTIFTWVNSSDTFQYSSPFASNAGYSQIFKIGTHKYIFVGNNTASYYGSYAVTPIYDDGSNFVFGNTIVGAPKHMIAGLLHDNTGIIVFEGTTVKKYVYIAGSSPELNVVNLTLQNVSSISGDAYANNSFVYTWDNHYIVVQAIKAGVLCYHLVLDGNTLTQIGAALSVSSVDSIRNIVAGLFKQTLYIYWGKSSGSVKTVVDASGTLAVTNTTNLSNLQMYYSNSFGSVSDLRYRVERTNIKIVAYLQSGTTRYINTFKPMDTVESSPNALYAMGSIAPNSYGKFRKQPEEG